MFEIGKLEFLKAVIHVLNVENDTPLCSTFEVDQEDSLTFGFIEAGLNSILASKDMKWGRFSEADSVVKASCNILSENLSAFMDMTKEISYDLFKLMKENPSMPSGDLLCVLFLMDDAPYLGVMKYNYKTFLTRKVEAIRDGQSISIVRDSSLFATNRHKADEGFVVHLMHMDIALLDKKYEINGEKVNYLKENFIKCESGNSEKEKLDIFNKVTKNIEDKYIGEDLEKKAKIKKAVYDAVMEDGALQVEKVVEKAFEENDEVRHIYKEALSKAGIADEEIEVPESSLKRKYEMQKITTETGIEIKIPVDYYGDDTKLEFVSNGDGSVSIVIKNVGSLQS